MKKPNKGYRRRPGSTSADDLAWLTNARDRFKDAHRQGLPRGRWPLRAAAMDKIAKALATLQHVLHQSIREAHFDTHNQVPPEVQPTDWLDYPPPRW